MEGEKKEAYLTVPSLATYLLIEPQEMALVAFARSDQGFHRRVLRGPEALLLLPELGLEIPLSELYEGVEFAQ